MYPGLDEGIFNALSTSQLSNLSKMKVMYIGKKKTMAETQTIEIAQTGDKPNNQLFDSDERVITYALWITLKKMEYLVAQKLLRDLVSDIKKELQTNPNFAWKDYMTIGDITPIYDDKGILRQAEVDLAFLTDEDYSEEETEIGEIDIRGGLD